MKGWIWIFDGAVWGWGARLETALARAYRKACEVADKALPIEEEPVGRFTLNQSGVRKRVATALRRMLEAEEV